MIRLLLCALLVCNFALACDDDLAMAALPQGDAAAVPVAAVAAVTPVAAVVNKPWLYRWIYEHGYRENTEYWGNSGSVLTRDADDGIEIDWVVATLKVTAAGMTNLKAKLTAVANAAAAPPALPTGFTVTATSNTRYVVYGGWDPTTGKDFTIMQEATGVPLWVNPTPQAAALLTFIRKMANEI
jgi:hypothetical protein